MFFVFVASVLIPDTTKVSPCMYSTSVLIPDTTKIPLSCQHFCMPLQTQNLFATVFSTSLVLFYFFFDIDKVVFVVLHVGKVLLAFLNVSYC